MTTIPKKARKPIAEKIHSITKDLRNAIPLAEIDAALREQGFMLAQEDGRPWSGFLCGSEGRCTLDVATLAGELLTNTRLMLMWYRHQTGRYETVAYVC